MALEKRGTGEHEAERQKLVSMGAQNAWGGVFGGGDEKMYVPISKDILTRRTN